MIIEGLPFIALRRYRPLIFDRYGQWSVTIELSGQTLQFSDVMGTVSFCIHFFEPYRLAAIKGGCVRSLLLQKNASVPHLTEDRDRQTVY